MIRIAFFSCAAHRERRIFYTLFSFTTYKNGGFIMENHLDFIVIKAEPKFRADSFVLDEADCSAAPVETGIVPVTLSLYACDKRDTAARRHHRADRPPG